MSRYKLVSEFTVTGPTVEDIGPTVNAAAPKIPGGVRLIFRETGGLAAAEFRRQDTTAGQGTTPIAASARVVLEPELAVPLPGPSDPGRYVIDAAAAAVVRVSVYATL